MSDPSAREVAQSVTPAPMMDEAPDPSRPAFPDLTNFNEFSAGIPYLPSTDCDPSEAIWSNKEPCQ